LVLFWGRKTKRSRKPRPSIASRGLSHHSATFPVPLVSEHQAQQVGARLSDGVAEVVARVEGGAMSPVVAVTGKI
jgi:hypothetical protein